MIKIKCLKIKKFKLCYNLIVYNPKIIVVRLHIHTKP